MIVNVYDRDTGKLVQVFHDVTKIKKCGIVWLIFGNGSETYSMVYANSNRIDVITE